MSRPMAALHYIADLGHYLASGSGVVFAVWGAADASVLQAWTGALIAVIAGGWGLWRDQRKNDRLEEDRKKAVIRHDSWDTFITNYRIKQIESTGKDPFARGCPPLDFIEAAEMAEIDRNAPAENTHVATTEQKPEPKPEPVKPKWPNLRHLFG